MQTRRISRAPLGLVASECEDSVKFLDILQKADVCHIAMCNDNIPYVVTMNFGIGNSEKNGFPQLYFHSSHEGKKIEFLKKNNLVCFQADIEHELFLHSVSCGCSMKYQSVVGMGRMHFVDDISEKINGLRSIMSHYIKKPEHSFKEELVRRTLILRLDIEEMTAKVLAKPKHSSASVQRS